MAQVYTSMLGTIYPSYVYPVTRFCTIQIPSVISIIYLLGMLISCRVSITVSENIVISKSRKSHTSICIIKFRIAK